MNYTAYDDCLSASFKDHYCTQWPKGRDKLVCSNGFFYMKYNLEQFKKDVLYSYGLVRIIEELSERKTVDGNVLITQICAEKRKKNLKKTSPASVLRRLKWLIKIGFAVTDGIIVTLNKDFIPKNQL